MPSPTATPSSSLGVTNINVCREANAIIARTVMQSASLYLAAALTAIWGVSHLFATKGVVAGFGDITADNRRIIAMEWIVEGVALVSIAAFVLGTTLIDAQNEVSTYVYAVAVGSLVVLAVVSIFTGFRIAFLPFRLCPFILGGSAALIAWGAWA